MHPFIYSSTSPRVVFGQGTSEQLRDELRRLGTDKPLLISSPSRATLAEAIRSKLSESNGLGNVELVNTALVHNPSRVIEEALGRTQGRDCLVSLGGGSSVGLGKALALRTGLPHVTLPTTYSGSEMTPILGETKDGKKVSTTDPRILPTVVIYDVDLSMDLPLKVTMPSGLNALAHSIEALYAEKSNPVSSLLALESIKAIVPSLLDLKKDPTSKSARTSLLYGAFLAGMTVASTGIALQHKLAHAAGGTLNLPHAETHAILLPHSVAYNASALPGEVVVKLVDALSSVADEVDASSSGIEQLVFLLNSLVSRVGIPKGLKELGMKEDDIDKVVDVAFERPYWNPRTPDRVKIREAIRRAWAGEPAVCDL